MRAGSKRGQRSEIEGACGATEKEKNSLCPISSFSSCKEDSNENTLSLLLPD